jgi:hypothetical protein
VKLTFPAKVRLSAMTIVNRREYKERTAGMVFQRLTDSGEWETIWKSDQPREVWNVDLTKLEPEEREATEFRLFIDSETPTYFHLANLSLWGEELPPPPVATSTPSPAPKPKKKP